MASQDNFLFSFLEELVPEATQTAKVMEDLIFEDPGSAIVKSRIFAEEILNNVLKNEEISNPYIKTLNDKIIYLAKDGVFNREIQQSFDTIRLSGNKAAHDSNFNDISIAFKLHKEMFKIALWYYEVYSTVQMRIPLYSSPKPKIKENIEELVKKQIIELFGNRKELIFKNEKKQDSKKDNSDGGEENTKELFVKNDLNEGESYLIREIARLKESSQEAIENANNFSKFKNYMHVDRKIQKDLEKILLANKDKIEGNLILLCGSVGDGKSHLLAFLNENKPELIKNYKIFNDATESFSPNKNAIETLEEVLKSFSDQNIKSSSEKIILAINMGVLHNFINANHKKYTYTYLKEFVIESKLFSPEITTHYSNNNIDLLSFGDYQSFELSENGPISTFYSTLLQKIFEPSNQNPFYLGLKEDESNNICTMVHENYRLLQNKKIQNQIVQLIIKIIIKNKLVISARAFLNFIADILMPDEIKNKELMNDFEVLEQSLPNLLFNRKERSTILNAISENDPIHMRSEYIDDLIVKLNTLDDWYSIAKENVLDDIALKWIEPFLNKSNLVGHTFNTFVASFIRLSFLTNTIISNTLDDKFYSQYVSYLYYFNTKNVVKIKEFYEKIKYIIFKWKGSPLKDYLYLDSSSGKYLISQKLILHPSIDHLQESNDEKLETFKTTIMLRYRNDTRSKIIDLEVDYKLFELLVKITDGYKLNNKDEEDAINFVEFVDKLMTFGNKKEELLFHFPIDKRFYTLKRDDFGSFVFEREF